ncbi:MAG: glycine cleavage system protein GcvH [Nocardioidaceae bacterium]
MYPEDLKYTAEHEWVRQTAGEKTVRVGITDYAQDALGDIVYVHLPDVGESVEAGAPMGELESTKSVSDLFAPLSGTIAARNEALDANPELCNADPYGDGWIVELELGDSASLDGLMTATDYEATVTSN